MTATTTRRALLAAGAATLAAPAFGQGFPQRPIRFICPFPAGGIVDLVMRTHTEELAAELGQPVVVDVRTGAGGVIASQQLVQAPADGHTWLMASLGNLVGPILTPSGFHPVEAVQGIAMVSYSISLVVVNASSPARNIADLAALARAQPGRLNYLRAGSGSFSHMSMELMQRAMGFQVTAVDYRGLPPGVVDLLAGRLDLAVLSTGIAMQHVREGRLRAIAAIGTSRAPEFPDVPTLTEQGVAEANLDSWYIAMAPRGVPEPVVARIADAYTRVLSRPAVADKLRAVGTVPARPIPPAEVQAVLAREYQKFATLIRDANIRAD